jgi:hypothetical protein
MALAPALQLRPGPGFARAGNSFGFPEKKRVAQFFSVLSARPAAPHARQGLVGATDAPHMANGLNGF